MLHLTPTEQRSLVAYLTVVGNVDITSDTRPFAHRMLDHTVYLELLSAGEVADDPLIWRAALSAPSMLFQVTPLRFLFTKLLTFEENSILSGAMLPMAFRCRPYGHHSGASKRCSWN